MKRCSICGKAFKGYGHNPEPVKRWMDGSCCDSCNASVVLPARIASVKQGADNGI